MKRVYGYPNRHGLYDPAYERDACGIGFVAHIRGVRSHEIVLNAAEVLRNMEHRGACGCEANTGDGAGMLTALPHEFLRRVARDELAADLPAPGQFAAGLVFLPTDRAERDQCLETVARIVARAGADAGRLAGRADRRPSRPTWDRPRGPHSRSAGSC